MDDLDPVELEALAVFQSVQVHKYLAAAVATCFIYDFLTMLDDEIKFVWSSSLGLADILYCATRYSAVPEICFYLLFYFGNLNAESCKVVAGYLSFSFGLGMLLSQGIVALRTWAIWNGSRAVQIACAGFALTVCAIISYLNVAWTLGTQFPTVPQLHSCSVAQPYRPMVAGWVLLSVADLSLLSLTVIKGRKQLRPDSPRLVHLLYRDAFTFFSLTVVCAIAALVISMVATAHFQSLLVGFERMFNSILAGRIIINLRAAALREEGLGSDLDHEATRLVFAERRTRTEGYSQ